MNLIKINEITYPNLVYPKLPRAGLGNMLLVWANAIVFAHINSIPIVCPNWGQIKIGTWIRGEKYKRFYGDYFCTKNYVSSLEFYICKLTKKYSVYYNPPLLPINQFLTKAETLQPQIFIFDRIPHWSDYFQGIKEYQYFVKEKLCSDIHPHLLKQILNIPAPEIALHVRLSDFRKVEEGEDFTKLGNARTPIDWFIRVLNSVRATARSMVPATIFSDFCSGFLSQKLTFLLRTVSKIDPLVGWVFILPLRFIPPLFDPLLSNIFNYPGYSICLEAHKNSDEKTNS